MRNSKLLFSSVVAVSAILGIGAASAADLPMKSLPMVAAPVFTWTGCYVGVHAGAGVLRDQGFQLEQGSGPLDRHGIGGLAGGQIGCNYQTGMLVLGIEGEGFWSGMKVTVDEFTGTDPGTLFSTTRIRNKWDYDVAGRIGVAFDHALVYGKAGWVFGGFDWNATDRFQDINQGSTTLNGLLIGFGLEYAFTNNWTAKFEYDYLGFGAKNVTFVSSCPVCTPFTFTENVSADKHIFKVGINYLFNAAAPLVAKY